MPVKKELIIKAISLCLKRLIPIASAATSFSLMALKALPYEELIISTIMPMHITVIMVGVNIVENPGIFLSP